MLTERESPVCLIKECLCILTGNTIQGLIVYAQHCLFDIDHGLPIHQVDEVLLSNKMYSPQGLLVARNYTAH